MGPTEFLHYGVLRALRENLFRNRSMLYDSRPDYNDFAAKG